MSTGALDPLIHDPQRLRIVAALAALPDGDALTVTRLQDMIGLPPGSPICRLRELGTVGYVGTEITGGHRALASPACCGCRRSTPTRCSAPASNWSKLSARMVQSIHAVLRNALESAVREEAIPRNVAQLVRVPAPRYKINRGLTTPQARATLRAAADQRLEALYVLAVFLGPRRGELLGLRWADVNLDRAQLEIVQTLQRIGGSLRLVPPKTENSARTVHCLRCASKRCGSTGNGSLPSAPKRGRTGRIMAWSSPLAAELRWSPTTFAAVGVKFVPKPG